jgi:serine/threonine-protein kinase
MSQIIGQTVGGRYHVDSLIAQGGMASVFLATDLRLDRKLALKVIHPHLANNASFVAKFTREAKIAAGLTHPNLINVFDQGQDGALVFLAMEYIKGITLRQALDDFGAFDSEQTLELIEGVLAGLAAAHKAGILHRDIKPENVFLADDGRIKLGDFGLAREIENNTTTGNLIGTVAYLSPELVTRGLADARSDIYAIGIMMFEMLTGKQPFEGEQAVQVAYQHANDRVPAPSTINARISPLLDEIVLWATTREAHYRPKNAEELHKVIVRAQKEIGRVEQAKTARVPRDLAPTSVLPDDALLFGEAGFIEDGDYRVEPEVASAWADNDGTTVLGDGWNDEDFGAAANSGGAVSFGGSTATQVLPSHLDGEYDDEQPEEPDFWSKVRRSERRRGWVWVALTAAVIVAGSATGWYFSAGPGALSTVPNLSGQSLTAAEQTLTAFDNHPAVVRENSSDVAKDKVTRTDPAAGTLATHGTHFKIFVSSGPKMVSAPDLYGLDLVSATARIAGGGFTLGKVDSWFNNSEATKVYDFSGFSGVGKATTTIADHSAIDLKVSLGPLPVVAGLSQDVATTLLTAAGLAPPSVSTEFSNTVAKGNVISLVPSGSLVGAGSAVQLVVSKGSETVLMPKVVGETIAAAQKLLTDAGLKPVVSTNQLQSNYGIAKVTSASKNQGATLHVGDTVIVSSY